MLDPQWQVQPTLDLPDWFIQAVRQHAAGSGDHAAQLLWQRHIRDSKQLAGFIDPNLYQPASPFEFEEMGWAVKRLQQAHHSGETVAIWGDFDADGITATGVLWDGLGQFFSKNQRLLYYIPNRLTESHGLAIAGITALANQGCRLIVTCDTGSTNASEINYARSLGIDVIITDHHTLPSERPDVVAIVNPRYLSADHPLAHLSGVAVAYKLVEALYETLPDVPERPLEDLLDLVAIGLIADLVQLTGDCRYLAQRGIERLQQTARPGIVRLLELCKRSGDRPTDISFGLGPRINAISRIHGDARFGVELLTNRDPERCRQLAEATELANTRRKSLQKDVAQQVAIRLAQIDLATTRVIVLADPQWSVGVLGLVAGQVAQEYGRPTILLSTEVPTSESRELEVEAIPLARGSARSVNQIDLYQLVKDQAHLLHRFGGHPFAAGLSLPVENIPLFTEAINRQLREQDALATSAPAIQADLIVTVADLGKDLFRELKLLEPCGMGNPTPKLMIQNCWFSNVWNRNIQDFRGRKVRYIKTEFELWDDAGNSSREGLRQSGFPGVWWEHYKDEVPTGRCDAIVELDYNTYQKRYEIRLLAVRPSGQHSQVHPVISTDWILDWRNAKPSGEAGAVLRVTRCPGSWDELQAWFRKATQEQQKLAIAYPAPDPDPPVEVWQRLVGIAKYLNRTGCTATRMQFHEKLNIGDRTLQVGFKSLKLWGFQVTTLEQGFVINWHPLGESVSESELANAVQQFLAAVQEEQFRRQYFYNIPLATIQSVAHQISA